MVDDMPATLADIKQRATVEEPNTQQMAYASVYEFYDGIIAPLLRDRLIGPRNQRWSAQWWKSPEAQMRLDALWRAYESLTNDPSTGLSVWLKDHFDPHMAVLTSEHGPFGDSRDSSKRGDYPSYEPPSQDVLEAKKKLSS